MELSSLHMAMMAVQTAAGLLLPALAALVLWKKYGCQRRHFFTGCAVFLLFAVVLEGLAHSLVLGGAAGSAIRSSRWLYALYGAAMAGLFEELGRYTAFRTVLRRRLDADKNALMYGAGHGGFECFYLLFFAGINNLLLASAFRSGGTEGVLAMTGGDAALAQQLIDSLLSTVPGLYLLGVVERCLAMTLHMALSVPVWFAAKNGGRQKGLLALAILLHFALDFVTVSLNGLVPALALEGILALMVVGMVLLARKIWRRCATSEEGGNAAEQSG